MERKLAPVQLLRRLLERPTQECTAEDVLAAPGIALPAQAGGQAFRFTERIRELSLDERQELFDETFGGPAGPAHARLMALLSQLDCPAEAQPEIDALLEDLDATLARQRNPYHHVLLGLRTLLASPR